MRPVLFHAMASDLKGFPSTTLRVAVTEVRGRNVWVRTADLLHAGCPLTLDIEQITPIVESVDVLSHRSGLTHFA